MTGAVGCREPTWYVPVVPAVARLLALLMFFGCQATPSDTRASDGPGTAPATSPPPTPPAPTSQADSGASVDGGAAPLPTHVSCKLFGPKEVLELEIDFKGPSGKGTLRRYGGSKLPDRHFRLTSKTTDEAVLLTFDGYLPEDKRTAQAGDGAVAGKTTLGQLLRTGTALRFLPDGQLDVSRGLGAPQSAGAYRCGMPTNVP